MDKYKRPRVQRLVPWRNPPARANDPNAWAQTMARNIIGTQRATQAAKVSGAMPGDYSHWELRADWQ